MKKSLSAAALACAVLCCSCGGNGNKMVTKGSLSKFDSLSYALGANVGTTLQMQFSDVPFNYDVMNEAIEKAAMGKPIEVQENSQKTLRNFFMIEYPARQRAIAAKSAAQEALKADTTGTVVDTLPEVKIFERQSECDSISRAFGNDLGHNIASSTFPIQVVWIVEAMKDARENTLKMDENEAQTFLQNYFTVVLPKKNAEASAAWLAQIEKKSGVKKTESGLLYKIETAGDPEIIAKDDRDTVVVNYEGKTRLGKVFDSSYTRGETAEFPLNRVIPGWTEGMKLVGKGGKITLWIPSGLAYGEYGAGTDIAPNEALQFTVEVVDVKPYTEPEAKEETTTEAAE